MGARPLFNQKKEQSLVVNITLLSIDLAKEVFGHTINCGSRAFHGLDLNLVFLVMFSVI